MKILKSGYCIYCNIVLGVHFSTTVFMLCRLWYVNIRSSLCEISQWKSLHIPHYGIWFLQSETRVSPHSRITYISRCSILGTKTNWMAQVHHCWLCLYRKQDGLLRSMSAEKLLKTLPCLQHLLDTLVEFDVRITHTYVTGVDSIPSSYSRLCLMDIDLCTWWYCLRPGYCQWADQRRGERCLHAPIQRPHPTLCLL